MNVGGLLLVFVLAIAAVFGIIMVAAGHTEPYVDSSGYVAGNATNQSQELVTNMTATGSQVGAGVAFFIAGIILLVVIIGLVWVAKKPVGRW